MHSFPAWLVLSVHSVFLESILYMFLSCVQSLWIEFSQSLFSPCSLSQPAQSMQYLCRLHAGSLQSKFCTAQYFSFSLLWCLWGREKGQILVHTLCSPTWAPILEQFLQSTYAVSVHVHPSQSPDLVCLATVVSGRQFTYGRLICNVAIVCVFFEAKATLL